MCAALAIYCHLPNHAFSSARLFLTVRCGISACLNMILESSRGIDFLLVYDYAIPLICRLLVLTGKICDAIEEAGKDVLSTSSTVTTGLVSHKYVSFCRTSLFLLSLGLGPGFGSFSLTSCFFYSGTERKPLVRRMKGSTQPATPSGRCGLCSRSARP